MIDDEDEEVECVDCGCDIIDDPTDPMIRVANEKLKVFKKPREPRCCTCEDHYYKLCDESCPVICDTCKEHHFGDCT